MRAERRGRRPCFIGDGLDGAEDPREIELDADAYEPLPPLDSAATSDYLRNGRS